MGGIVKSVQKAVGGILGTNKKAPDIIMPDPVTQAVMAPQEQAQAPVQDTEQGASKESVQRKGKGALKVSRQGIGGGSGLNM